MPTSLTRALIVLIAVLVSVALSGCSAARAEGFTFVHFTDPHMPTYGFAIGLSLEEKDLLAMSNQQRIRQFVSECLALKPKPAFVVNTGDTADVGWMPMFRLYSRLMQPLVSAGIPIYTVTGNHDTDYTGLGPGDLGRIFDPLGPALIGRHGERYSFDLQDCHFAVINNTPICGLLRVNPVTLEWLRKDLEKVDKDKRVFVFLHATMSGSDMYSLVEMLQRFRHPLIFRGHRHYEAVEKWAGVPMIVTGALYGGRPKAGSYREVKVLPDRIVTRVRDFAKPAGTWEPEKIIASPPPGPMLRIVKPSAGTVVGKSITVVVETEPDVPGSMEYLIPGFRGKWTPVQGGGGRWTIDAPAPDVPGRHFLAVRFKGQNGAITLAHAPFRVRGEKVQEVWARNLGSAIQGAAAIWQDMVIVPTLERGVYALSLDDGKEIWHRKAPPGQIPGRVVVDGDTIYYGAGSTVYACRAKSGQTIWQATVKGTIVTGLTAGDGKVFVPAGEHKLYCLDARSGRVQWHYAVGLPILTEPVVGNGKVFFGAMDGYFRALDVAAGAEVWKHQSSEQKDIYTSAPLWPAVLTGDKVIVAKRPARRKEDRNLVAFDQADGNVIWSRRVNPGWPARVALNSKGDRLYAPYYQYSPRREAGLQCFSVKDGSPLWKRPGVGMAAANPGGDDLLVRDGNRSLYCLNAATGKVKWTYRASVGPQGNLYGASATIVKGNLAIVGTMDGYIVALKW